MEDRPLKFSSNDDPTPVVYDEIKLKKVTKAVNDLSFASIELGRRLKEGNLEQGFKSTLLSLIESHAITVAKEMDYESDLIKEKEERFVEIRSLNEENRELRRQLGEKVSSDDVKEKLKNLSTTAKAWAKSMGLYIRDIRYTDYGNAIINLDPGISSIIFDEDTKFPEVKAARENRGHVFRYDGSGRSADFLFTDRNLELIRAEIEAKFPGCRIGDIKISERGDTGDRYMEIDSLEVYIYSLDQITQNDIQSNN